MSLLRLSSFVCVTALLTACGGAEYGPASTTPTDPATGGSTAVAPNTLPQSGQGNSGGVLTGDGPAAAGVEATMRYNGESRRSSGANVAFHNGDLTGVTVTCTRAGGGAVVPECSAVNADRAWLVNELSGRYAYAGAFAVEGHGPNGDQNSFVAIHSGPGMNPGEGVTLPGDSLGYRGSFQAGAGLTQNGTHYEGRVVGDMNLTADFNAGSLSGDFEGLLRADDRGTDIILTAGFEDAVIGPDGRFYNANGTTFSYNGAQAWGELDGAFYGPNAEEAAGTFGFGNETGGMTGIMLGCSEYSRSNCVVPSPRF